MRVGKFEVESESWLEDDADGLLYVGTDSTIEPDMSVAS